MNISILKKVLVELQKDDFRKDYVIGILETMIETQTDMPTKDVNSYLSGPELTIRPDVMNISPLPTYIPTIQTQDEGSILDAKARVAMAKVKALSNNE